MQSVVVQFDMQAGLIVSNAAQNGFGAANKLHMLTMTPLNAFGTALTSFTAQNLGAGKHERIRRGAIQASIIMALLAALSAGAGLLMTIGDTYFHVFLSADKVTPETIRYGNAFLYVDYAMYLLLGGIFLMRNCDQGIGRSQFTLAGGAAELVARIAVSSTLPAAIAGGVVSASAPSLAFYALCAADPAAWLATDIILAIPFIKNILRQDYRYLYGEHHRRKAEKSVVSIRTGGLMKQPSFFSVSTPSSGKFRQAPAPAIRSWHICWARPARRGRSAGRCGRARMIFRGSAWSKPTARLRAAATPI